MSDLISRLSEIRSQYNCFNGSEEPYYRALSEVIKMLSEQADGDTISRQVAIDALDCINGVEEVLRSLPSAQPDCTNCIWDVCNYNEAISAQPERKKGEWNIIQGNIVVCSECGMGALQTMTGCLVNRHLEPTKTRFCPNCGAEMRGTP